MEGFVGRRTLDGWWVRLRVEDPSGEVQYLLSRGEDRHADAWSPEEGLEKGQESLKKALKKDKNP